MTKRTEHALSVAEFTLITLTQKLEHTHTVHTCPHLDVCKHEYSLSSVSYEKWQLSSDSTQKCCWSHMECAQIQLCLWVHLKSPLSWPSFISVFQGVPFTLDRPFKDLCLNVSFVVSWLFCLVRRMTNTRGEKVTLIVFTAKSI